MTKDEFLFILNSELENLEKEYHAIGEKYKDEFLSLLNGEFESLQEEYHPISERYNYLAKNGRKGNEFQEMSFQEELFRRKYVNLYHLVRLPAYARIQAMSDVEIEDYKKSKIEELELKVKEIESREKQEKATFFQLKAELAQISSQLGTDPFISDRDMKIYRSQQLSSQISMYDANNPFGKFAMLKKKLEEVRKQQEKIKALTSQEIKQQLSAKIEGSYNLKQIVERTQNPIGNYREVLASVASDSKKAQEVSNLVENYRQLSNKQKQVIDKLYLGRGLPYQLESKLIKSRRESLEDTDKAMEVSDRLIKTVNEFEGSFKQAKANFMEQITEQKLSKLVGKDWCVYGTEVDFDFLRLHNDKLSSGKLIHLESIVKQRNKLAKKIFKTRDIKYKIESLNQQIEQEQSSIYMEIIYWYDSQCQSILGMGNLFDYNSLETLKSSVEDCKKDIGQSEQAIIEVKERIQKSKAQIESYETRKKEIIQQIKTLGGEKYKETDFSISEYSYDYFGSIENPGLNTIANSSAYMHERELVNKIQQEAQNQADIREAELREISVKQLLEMRQQEQMAMDEVIQEEASNGMKR